MLPICGPFMFNMVECGLSNKISVTLNSALSAGLQKVHRSRSE